MRQIQFTRKAIKDLQRLQSSGSLKTPERLLHQLAETRRGDKFSHTIHLSGYTHLWRSRIDLGGGSSLRLIWVENVDDSSIRFLYADQRDSDTYAVDLKQLPQEPAYFWRGESGAEWSLFMNGAYNASPILTEQQRSTSAEIGIGNSYTACGASRRIGFFAHITQSPPGTGKTITAAVRACELYQSGWNVIFLLPQRLIEDVKGFRCMQSIPSDPQKGFFYGTFQDWIAFLSPELSSLSLSPEDELDILRGLAIRAEKAKQTLKLQEVGLRDLILFQAFVLNHDPERHKSSVYRDNQDRIKALSHIRPDWWNREFLKLEKQPRRDIAQRLSEKWKEISTSTLTKGRVGSIIIIDEAQDYLTSEIEALKQLCKSLHRDSHPTYLWLLGDLNQRIMPVDFDWGALGLVKNEVVDWKCFRNSKHILQFSNLLLSPVTEASHRQSVRLPQQPADPDRASEIGEPVKLIVYPDQATAESFLGKLSQSIGISHDEIQEGRSLVRKLANRVKILTAETYESRYSDELDFLNVHEVKGREFDACIAFNIFNFAGQSPVSEDWWQWYTLLTRTRSRLLVVVTQAQYEFLEMHVPDILLKCEHVSGQCQSSIDSLCQWIRTENNDVEFSMAEREVVKRYLVSALREEKPILYWDTYQVLDGLNIRGKERTMLEEEMIQLMKQYPVSLIKAELSTLEKEAETGLLTSLLLRSMGQCWKAAQAVDRFKETDQSEYVRSVEAIVETLEANELFVEAARLRCQRLDVPYPDHFPFPEAAQTEGNLVDALVSILKAKFQIEIEIGESDECD